MCLEKVVVRKMADMILEFYEEVLKRERADHSCVVVKDALKTIRSAYQVMSDNGKRVPVDYNEARNRYAYIYYYAACHTLIVSRQAERILLKNPLTFLDVMGYEKEELNICSLGGGPGCDLIGLLRLRSVAGLGETKKINCTVIDVSSGWQQSQKNVVDAFLNSSEGSLYRKKLRVELIRSDLLARPWRSSALLRIASADVLTLVKFVSAIPDERTPVTLEVIFSLLKPGAYVFFLDNARGGAYETTATAAIKAGLTEDFPKHQILENVTEDGKLPSIGPLKDSVRPLKSTSVCSCVWKKSR